MESIVYCLKNWGLLVMLSLLCSLVCWIMDGWGICVNNDWMLISWQIYVTLEDKHVISVGEFDNVHIWLIFQLYLLVFWAYIWKTEWNLLIFIHNGQVMTRKGKLEESGRFLYDFEARDLVSRFRVISRAHGLWSLGYN